jgi:hypothetical protein
MKHLQKTIVGLVLLLGLAASGFAQTALTQTTLSSAITDSKSQIVVVASATGITAGTSFIYVDNELMQVNSLSGTSLIVVRGAGSTKANTHASAAIVFIGASFNFANFTPQGSCTRGSGYFLFVPYIDVKNSVISDCIGGQIVSSDYGKGPVYPQFNGIRFPDPGGVIYTSLETNGTAPSAATEIYCTEIDLPQSMNITGLGVLNGTTVGTDNHWMILYDSSGKVLANSAAAGALAASGSAYQKFDFTAKYYAVGPARYFGCMGSNGTTATIRHAITSTNDNILGGAVTTQVFGTAAAITVPSTFTTAKAPYLLVY